MHSKLYAVRLNNEYAPDLVDQVKGLIDEYPYDSQEIDYFQTMEELSYMGNSAVDPQVEGQQLREVCIKSLTNRLCNEYFAYRLDKNKVKFTRKGMEKYFSNKIEEILEYVNSFRTKEYSNSVWSKFKHWLFGTKLPYTYKYDTVGFVNNMYHLQYGIVNEEDPKFYSTYTYMVGESEFIKALYGKMNFEKIDEIEVEVVDVWDYHF